MDRQRFVLRAVGCLFLLLAAGLGFGFLDGRESDLAVRENRGGDGVPLLAQNKLSLQAEQMQAQVLVQALPIEHVLGTLAPVALSPFFALTCLSGAALLSDSGLLPDKFAKHAVLGANSPLKNGTVFVGLLGLTILTALPKLTKVTKPLAQAVDQLENYSGIVAVMVVQYLSQVQWGEATAMVEVPLVVHAGVIEVSYTTLLMVFSAINLFVVNAVKFFFETMIWISPIPAVDAFFEVCNKLFAAALVGLYLINPWLAMLVNLAIFGLCLLIFAWVYRRVVFFRSAVGDPLFGWLGRLLFFRKRPTLTSTRLPRSVLRVVGEPSLVLYAFSGSRLPKVAVRTRGYLIEASDRAYFAQMRFLRGPRVIPLPDHTGRVRVKRGLLTHSVLFHEGTSAECRFQITRRYSALLSEIERVLMVADVPRAGAVEGAGFREIGEALRSASRNELKAELG